MTSIQKHGPIAIIVSIAALVRLFRLGHQSLWLDECFSLGAIDLPNPWPLLTHGSIVNPPLYYLFMRYWVRTGDTDLVLRLPSAIFGVLTTLVIFMIARRLFGRKVALIASYLFAISPLQIWYAQEVRMYSLVLLLTAAATLFLLKLLEDRSRSTWIAYVGASVLGVATHFSAFFVVFFHVAYLFWAGRRARPILKRILLFYGLMAILIFPLLLPHIAGITSSETYGVFADGPGWARAMVFPYTFYAFSVGLSLGPSVPELHALDSPSLFASYAVTIILVLLLFGYASVAGIRALRRNRDNTMILTLYLLVPLISIFLLALFRVIPTYNVRYVLVALPAYLLILSVGLGSISNRMLFSALIILVSLASAASLRNYYFVNKYHKPDVRSAARFVEEREKTGDIILTTDAVPFHRYYDGLLPCRALWIDSSAGSEEQRFFAIERRLSGFDRVWIVLDRTWVHDPHGLILPYLLNRYESIQARDFPGVEVHLVDLTN